MNVYFTVFLMQLLAFTANTSQLWCHTCDTSSMSESKNFHHCNNSSTIAPCTKPLHKYCFIHTGICQGKLRLLEGCASEWQCKHKKMRCQGVPRCKVECCQSRGCNNVLSQASYAYGASIVKLLTITSIALVFADH